MLETLQGPSLLATVKGSVEEITHLKREVRKRRVHRMSSPVMNPARPVLAPICKRAPTWSVSSISVYSFLPLEQRSVLLSAADLPAG